MEITINVRRGKLPDSLRNQAMRRFGRLERIENRITGATLVIDETTAGYSAEVRLVVPGAQPLIGRAEETTLRSALSGAFDRATRRLTRRRQRRTARRTRVPARAAE